MHNKRHRSYTTFCFFFLVSCLLPPGVFSATPALSDSGFTLTLAPPADGSPAVIAASP